VPCTPSRGFTLIEVIAALVIFSLGVLMVIQVSGSLSQRLEWAATASEIVVVAQERLDSLETVPFASLAPGTWVDSLTVKNRFYIMTTTVTQFSVMLKQIDVSIAPGPSVSGPSHSTTSYVADAW
jgi:prepilin-type N-terminal cleavage/methylation domain-containing protein